MSSLKFVSLLCLGLLASSIAIAAETPKRLTLLHTNDWQSRYLGYGPNADYQPESQKDDGTIGGISRLASLIKQKRAALGQDNLLLLDGGDYSMGTLFHTIIRETGSELQLMQALGYDAITFGNHDFDFYPDGLAQSIRSAIKQVGHLPPIIASNLQFSQSDPRDDDLEALWNEGIIKPYVILHKAGLKIGVFGMLGYKATDVAANAKPLTFADPIETAKKMVKRLKQEQKVDLVILMSHGGILKDPSAELGWRGDDIDLINQVEGMDIIVGGHSHTPLKQPIVKDQRIVIQAGSEIRFLGELELTVSNGKIEKYQYQLQPINGSIIGDPKINQMIDGFKQQVTDLFLADKGYQFDQAMAAINKDLTRAYEDHALGNLVADAIKKATGVQIGLTTNGSIRDNLYYGKQGLQQVSDLFRVVPLGVGLADPEPGYDLLTFWVTAKEIKNLMEVLIIGSQLRGQSYFPRFSGIKVQYNTARLPFDQVMSIELGDEQKGYQPLDLSSDNQQLYSMATNSFIGSLMGLIEKISQGLLEINAKNQQGQPITQLKQALFDADPSQEGRQNLKEWASFFQYIENLPRLEPSELIDNRDQRPLVIQLDEKPRLIKIHSYNPINLFKNASYIMYLGSFILVLLVILLLWLARWVFAKRTR